MRQKLASSFNKVLHDAGYDGILDVDGQFLLIESCQGVQTWPGAVDYVESIKTPHKRDRDYGGVVTTSNPDAEKRLERVKKYLQGLKPGSLKLSEEQFSEIVYNFPKELRPDVAQFLLGVTDLSLIPSNDTHFITRSLLGTYNHRWDFYSRNPTLPVWYWEMLLHDGDLVARAMAKDKLGVLTNKLTISEVLGLEERAISFGDLSKSTVAMHVFKPNAGEKIVALYKPEVLQQYMHDWESHDGLIVGFIRVIMTDFDRNIWEVKGSAAEKGYGPIMYDIAMSLIYPNYLMADRSVVSPAARNVWKYMYDHRIEEYDVRSLPAFYRWSNLNPESPNHNLPWLDVAYRLKKKLAVYSSLYNKDSRFFSSITDRDMKRRTLDTLEEYAWTYFRDRTESE